MLGPNTEGNRIKCGSETLKKTLELRKPRGGWADLRGHVPAGARPPPGPPCSASPRRTAARRPLRRGAPRSSTLKYWTEYKEILPVYISKDISAYSLKTWEEISIERDFQWCIDVIGVEYCEHLPDGNVVDPKLPYFFSFFFWSKTVIYLSLGLHKGRPSYRRSLHLLKENIQHFKTWNF